MKLNRLIVFIAILALFLLNIQKIRSGDILWHLKIGELALEKVTISEYDQFSHTMYGKPVTPHAPLFQAVVGFVYRVGGFGALSIFNALLVALLFSLAWIFCLRIGVSGGFESLILAAMILIVQPQLQLQPQLIFLIFVEALLCLGPSTKLRSDSISHSSWLKLLCKIVGSSLIVLIWPFVHPSFIVGIIMLLLFGLSELVPISKSGLIRGSLWFAGFILTVVAIWLIKPAFYFSFFKHMTSPAMLSNVKFWQPFWKLLSLTPTNFWVVGNLSVISLAAILSFIYKSLWKVLAIHILFLSICAIVGATLSLRFIPLVPIILGPVVLKSISDIFQDEKYKCKKLIFSIYFAGTVVFAIFFLDFKPGLTLDETDIPKGCVDYLRHNSLAGEMYNSYNFGSYLIFAFGGEKRVFIDPRSTQVYPDELIARFVKAYEDQTVFEELVRQYKVGYTFLKLNSPLTKKLIQYLDHSPSWELAYKDSVCVIHQKKR